MKVSLKHLACFGVALLVLSGCASTPFKPKGLTDLEAQRKADDILYTCQGLRQGTLINVSFYPEAADLHKKEYAGTRSGYLYACNRLNGTLYMSDKELTMLDRGNVYPIKYIQTISKEKDAPSEFAYLHDAIKGLFGVKHDDPEHTLLTQ